ncbi:MAG: glycosyltransferase, partial [Candidatus Sumerlaeia bacterium]|nr:glycosyltransferase [Candidatus Sumerlaeia bacterium]
GVAEAMGAAVPVLLGRGNQFAGAVEEHRLGRIVGETVEDWIAVLDLLEEGLPNDMGENGRKYAREHLSWGPVSARLRDLYREAAGGVH